ncbi:hypothetical protein WP5W18E02_15940 [Aeromonas caviae]|nr:hypothetical protein WP5W18E02_15940 [Aeromonas caviae]
MIILRKGIWDIIEFHKQYISLFVYGYMIDRLY